GVDGGGGHGLRQPEGERRPRVEESDSGDRIDPLMRSLFGIRRKSPPEKYSDGDGVVVAGGGGGRR
ncbi:hypothetical protein Tco_0482922, partial [Tanacetum coccineum]